MSLRQVSSIDVARVAGVSQSTVSRVFSDSNAVTLKTRDKVLQVARKLGYKPNAIARSLSRQRTDIVGIVMADMTNPFIPILLEQLTQRLQSTGRHVLLFNVTADREVDDALPFLLQYQVDAIIITSATISSEMANECARRGTPVILVNRYVPGANASAVSCDNVAGGRLVADLFLDARHTRLAYVAGWQNTSTNLDREKGFGDRLRERNQIAWLRELGEYTYDSGYAAARRLLQRDDPPDAIFCANDSMAMGALDAARELRIRVPEQLSIIGFDNIPAASWQPYSLTTIQQPIDQMVDRTLELLDARIGGADIAPAQHLIPGTLIRRQSARLALEQNSI
ncbi:MAG: LacI family DNA-binding transcriptional regulator [Chloroflexi bacterium]|nr:LacI family DNA-binding transcriptional regulator [Chloroflexota bacterium]